MVSRLVKKRKKLFLSELQHYIKKMMKDREELYFPTNMLKTILLKERGVYHCWETYRRKLTELEKSGKLETIDTVYGKMWRIKNG